MGGAFQTSRDIFRNPIWQDIPKFRLFFFIVGNAVFSKEGVRVGNIVVKRGQFLRSYRNLRDDLEYIENRAVKKYSTSVIKRKIDSLVKEERLKIEDTELGTLFTVVNYDHYQVLDNYKKQPGTALEQRENRDGTALEQGWNNNKNVEEGCKKVEEISSSNSENAHAFYEQNFAGFTPFIAEELTKWVNDLSEELVIEALKISKKRGKQLHYADGIMKDWFVNGYTTLQEVKLAEEKHHQNKGGNKGYGSSGGSYSGDPEELKPKNRAGKTIEEIMSEMQ